MNKTYTEIRQRECNRCRHHYFRGGYTPDCGDYCTKDSSIHYQIKPDRPETTCWDTYRVFVVDTCPICGTYHPVGDNRSIRDRIDGEIILDKKVTCKQCGCEYLSYTQTLLRCRFCDHEFDENQTHEEIEKHLLACTNKKRKGKL